MLFADIGVPMISVVRPAAWALLIPVILIDAGVESEPAHSDSHNIIRSDVFYEVVLCTSVDHGLWPRNL